MVPAYNAERFLGRAVESLLATGYADLEILIVDDGSSDGTLGLATALQARYPKTVRVRTHPGGGNRGVSATRNRGIAASTGDLVCFLDADDYVLPHRFESAVELLRTRPDCDGVYELAAVAYEGGVAEAGWGDNGAGDLFGLTTPHEGEALVRQLLRGYPWHPDAFLCRRSLLRRTGGFHEGLRIAEDCHLWFRAAAVGRILPGDLTRPVSVYVRHDQNTYSYALERKIDMMRAMASALRWVKGRGDERIRRVFAQGVLDYAINGVIVAREARRPGVGWAITAHWAGAGDVRGWSDGRWWRQVWWLVRETLAGRPLP